MGALEANLLLTLFDLTLFGQGFLVLHDLNSLRLDACLELLLCPGIWRDWGSRRCFTMLFNEREERLRQHGCAEVWQGMAAEHRALSQ